jgi:hypothetical protein
VPDRGVSVSECRVCGLMQVPRTSYQYQSRHDKRVPRAAPEGSARETALRLRGSQIKATRRVKASRSATMLDGAGVVRQAELTIEEL